jgi:DNA (cytosine-5)-methyltransferase 1
VNFTYGSLFTGIAGFDLGFDRAGMECAWQVEIDERCNQVLECRYPDVERFGDVKDVGKRNLRPVDLICGGFPCQDLSVAGKRAGLAGERSGLWWEFARIIEELRPRWVIIENVPGLLSSWSPVEPPPFDVEVRDFDTKEEAEGWADGLASDWRVEEASDLETILAELGQLGYSAAYRVFDAQYFGVAQRRRRVFIVGSLGNGRAAQVLFESEGGAWDTPPGREERERTTRNIAYSFRNGGRDADQRDGRSGIGLERELSYTLQGEQQHAIVQHALSGHNQRNDPDGEHFIVYQCHGNNVGPMGALRKGNGTMTGGVPFVARPLANGQTTNHYDESQQTYITIDARNMTEDEIAMILQAHHESYSLNAMPLVFDTTQITSPENCSNPKAGDPCHPLASGAHPPAIAFEPRYARNGRGAPDSIVPPLKAESGRTGKGDGAALVAQVYPTLRGQPNQGPGRMADDSAIAGLVRRLTPTECERLQGFPDGWTRYDADGNELSDSARYRMLGNAVAVPVAEWIGGRILEALAEAAA